MSEMRDPVYDMLRGMSIEQMLGQSLMVGFSGYRATPEALDLITSGHVGGVILFSRNFASPEQARELTATLQQAAHKAGHPLPLLIATDQENGIIRRTGPGTTFFPGNAALGAVASEEATEAVARATGEELRSLGVTMNLAPDVDVANNPDNPVIGVRSFGADPGLVGRLGAAAVRGYRAAGVASTIKHFPGHGDTAVDSHQALPVITADRARLDTIELPPFRAGIAAGADAVMTAHIAMPAITSDLTLPATLAAPILRGMLRDELGFGGVVISDCLEMHAINGGVGVALGAVQAVLAGADIVLISHLDARQRAGLIALRDAVAKGEISGEAVRAAAERVLRLKQRLIPWDEALSPRALSSETMSAHQRLADDLYARSVTALRDDAGTLPLNLPDGAHALVVSQKDGPASLAADLRFSATPLVDELRRLRPTATIADVALPAHPIGDDLAALTQRAAEADVVILLTCNAHLPRHLTASQAVAQSLLTARRPVIAVAVCDAHDADALPEIRTWLATYDYLAPALAAAARKMVAGG